METATPSRSSRSSPYEAPPPQRPDCVLYKLAADYEEKFKRHADREAFLLSCLVEYELKQNKEETWQFSAGGLAEIQEDFTLLSDYESGQHMQNLETQVTRWGWSCLTDEQNKIYAALKGAEADKWLIENTREHFRTLWHFWFQCAEHFKKVSTA